MREFGNLTRIQQVVTSAYTRANGCSININSGNDAPNTGYMVGISNLYTGSLQLCTHPFAIAQRIERDHSPVSNRLYVGSWNDNETGIYYMDLSQWVGNLDEALEIASNRNEIAVWDCENNEEIRL